MSLLEAAISWLAPPQCIGCGVEGSALCSNCSADNILPFGPRCWNCNVLGISSRTCLSCQRLGPLRHVWISTIYDDGVTKDLVRKYKFGHLRAAALPLSQIMADTVLMYPATTGQQKQSHLVVPVPTASIRIRQRSFDHTVLLARHVSRQLGMEYGQVLGRIGQTAQIGAGRSERLKQAASQYHVVRPKQVYGQNILLIDDVLTTGATLLSAAAQLRRAGATNVDAVVFAKRL